MKVTKLVGHDRLNVAVKDGKKYARLNFSRSGVAVTTNHVEMRPIGRQLAAAFDELNKTGISYGAMVDKIQADFSRKYAS